MRLITPLCLLLALQLPAIDSAAEQEAPEALAYYGDAANDLVYVIDLEAFRLFQVYPMPAGSKPYPVDHAGSGTTYISTRGISSLSVIPNYDLSLPLTRIALQHQPRSTTAHPSRGLALTSGADVSLSSMIRTRDGKVRQVVGDGLSWNPSSNTDFGGSNATGHPFWDRGKKHFLLDRVQRHIALYKGNGDLLDTLPTASSAHHLLRAPTDQRRTYFAALEGNPAAGIPPAVLKFRVRQNRFEQLAYQELQCAGCFAAQMGGHHADLTPDGQFIYMGSNEGHTFVLNSNDLSIARVINTGAGAGHTRFVASRNLAIVTNHNDTFITLIDTRDHSRITDVVITDSCTHPGRKLQGHTTGISPDSRYFYIAASCDGRLVKLDLDTLQSESLDLSAAVSDMGLALPGGTAYPIQGAAYIWD